MSEHEQLGTFFGIPVVVNEHLKVGERDLGVVRAAGLFDQTFVLVEGDDSITEIELDQAHAEVPK